MANSEVTFVSNEPDTLLFSQGTMDRCFSIYLTYIHCSKSTCPLCKSWKPLYYYMCSWIYLITIVFVSMSINFFWLSQILQPNTLPWKQWLIINTFHNFSFFLFIIFWHSHWWWCKINYHFIWHNITMAFLEMLNTPTP